MFDCFVRKKEDKPLNKGNERNILSTDDLSLQLYFV